MSLIFNTVVEHGVTIEYISYQFIKDTVLAFEIPNS